ncbi:hypothetical protein SBA2_410001 [Acidobacteriia bacterium SbA2]|nr:hypothetical protein SBA2_410001 [Acidobacteriia bacterium SbA2]
MRSIREFWIAVVTLPPQQHTEAVPISQPPG